MLWLEEKQMDIGPTELLIVLLIVVLLFGGGRIARLGGELGQGLREFRKGLAGEDEAPAKTSAAQASAAPDASTPTDPTAK
jgi:sec-independent protein translocase protein TatA